MKKTVYAILLLLVVGGAFLLGTWSVQHGVAPKSTVAGRTVLYYEDPMHPAYRSDKPGIAPDCGMELVPVYEDGSTGDPGSMTSDPPGTVSVSPEKQQLIGVRVATVQKVLGRHTLRVLGRVVPDETRIYRINSATDGWVKKMPAVTTGSLVGKDELLATFYAPEFLSAMRAYLYGLRSLDRFEASSKETKDQIELTSANIDSYRNGLRNLGMTEHQMDDIQRTRQPAENIEIRAPEAGFILAKNLTLGERFLRGTELYRIADLSQVWIVAETYETEASSFKPGTQVRVAAPQLRKTFSARVAQVPPRFDPASRTLQVRLEADNPGLLLRPDMFVDVELPITLPPAIAVPADALVDSGVKKTVFVDKGNGVFEPRKVETGWRAGDQVEIVKGLMAGERIVVSGTFLLDSESRMKAAAAGATGHMHEGHSHPAEATVKDGMAVVARGLTTAIDPICGMDVDIQKASAAGRTSVFQGKSYYFCSDDCKVTFDKDPKRYTGASAKPGT